MLLEDNDQERTLLPVFLRERLLPTSDDDEDACTVGYKVTDAGPALQDVVAGSHSALVRFIPNGPNATDMEWAVDFDTVARGDFWEAFTRT